MDRNRDGFISVYEAIAAFEKTGGVWTAKQ